MTVLSMSTISRKTAALIVVTGSVSLLGLIVALGPTWLASDEGDAAAINTDELSIAETPAWPEPPYEPRVRTRRPLLELVGVTFDARGSSAMIREKDGETRTYRVGDQVIGDRELVEIHDTYVMMRDDEGVERLRITGRSAHKQADPEELQEFAEQLTTGPD
jgi:hypothetical protein